MSPLGLILLGFALCVVGLVLPVMMLLGTIPTTFLLGFLAYAASVAGLLMGIIGGAMYVARRRGSSR